MKHYSELILICLLLISMWPLPVQADDWVMTANGPASNNVVSEEIEHPLKFKWKYETGGYATSPPAIAGSFAYLGSNDRVFHKIDIRNGKNIWKYDSTGNVLNSPAIYNNTIFLSSSDRHLYAFDPKSCENLFEYHTEGIFSKILIFNDTLFVGSDDNHVHAIDPSTGKLKWKFNLGNDVKDSFAISNTGLYIGSLDGHLYALNLSNGEQIWEYETKGSIDSSPVILDENIYFSSWDGHIYALSANTGKIIWKKMLHSDNKMYLSASEKSIFITSRKNPVYALDSSNGNIRWKHETSEQISTPAVVTPAHLYIGSTSGNIFVLEKDNGDIFKKYYTGNVAISSLLISSKMLFFTVDNGVLYAYGPEEVNNGVLLSEQNTALNQDTVNGANNPNVDSKNTIIAEQNINTNATPGKDDTQSNHIISKLYLITEQFSLSDLEYPEGFTIYIPFILLTIGFGSTLIYSRLKKKKNIEKGFIMLAGFNTKNDDGYMSGELYARAEELIHKGNLKKGTEQLHKANAYYLKEKPLLDKIGKLSSLKKGDSSKSDVFIKKAILSIKKIDFNEAKKLLVDAEEVINRENKLLQEGRGTYQKYNDMNITINESGNDQNVALANDLYNQIEELKKARPMESERSNSLIQKIQNELLNYNFDNINKYIEQLKTLIQEERPYLNMIKEIENIRNIEISTSDEMVKKALKQIESSNYPEAEKLLLTAKKIVEQENMLLKEIEQIQNIAIPDMEESTFDQYQLMKELGEGKFEAVKRKIILAKHEKLKSALIEDIEDVLK